MSITTKGSVDIIRSAVPTAMIIKKMKKLSSLWMLSVFLSTTLQAQGADQKVEDLLGKLLKAKEGINYEGVQTVITIHSDEPQIKRYFVSHIRPNKEKRVQILPSGEWGEVLLGDSQFIWRYIPEKGIVIKQRADSSSQPLEGNQANVDAIMNNYHPSLVGEGEVCTKECIQIAFKADGPDGPVKMEVWMDKETGLALRTNLYDTKGKLVRVTAFDEIKYSATPDKTLDLKVPQGVQVYELPDQSISSLASIPPAIKKRVFKVGRPPAGYSLRRIFLTNGANAFRLHMIYSDGIFPFSVFETPEENGGEREGWRKLEGRGVVNVLKMIKNGTRIEIVGNMHEKAMDKIADSLVVLD